MSCNDPMEHKLYATVVFCMQADLKLVTWDTYDQSIKYVVEILKN